MSLFSDAIGVTPLGDGRYAAELGDRWTVGPKAHGGLLMVLLARAGAQQHPGGITVAVQAECAACGHWMLFDSLKFRTGQERGMLFEVDEEDHGHPEE